MKKFFRFRLSGLSLLECVVSLALVVLITGMAVKFWDPLITKWRTMQQEQHYPLVLDEVEVAVLQEPFENYFNWAQYQNGIPVKSMPVDLGKNNYHAELSLLKREGIDYQYGVPLWVEIFTASPHKKLLMAYPLMKRREE